MEKIYMEDNNKKGKKSVIDISVVLSFAVAIFAIFSLVMADLSLSQRSNVSYAALDTSFTFKMGDALVGSATGYASFGTRMYSTSDNKPVFCIEYGNNHIVDGSQYTAGDAITDYGLLYLLSNSYANGHEFVNASTAGITSNGATVAENAKYINSWITQAAIWDYLYVEGGSQQPSSFDFIDSDAYNGLKYATKIVRKEYNEDGSAILNEYTIYEGANLYEAYINPLVTAADAHRSNEISLSVNLASTEISTDENKNFYFSAPITVTGTPADKIQSYTITLSGIEGAIAVYEDGSAVYEDSSNEGGNIAYPGAPFRIRIPAEKIKEEVQTVNVEVKGNFNTLVGQQYVGVSDGNLQKVVAVEDGVTTISKGTEVEFYGAPDTGMSTAQTIYFIGLIVLLCGVGIVYANAKPVQVKQ